MEELTCIVELSLAFEANPFVSGRDGKHRLRGTIRPYRNATWDIGIEAQTIRFRMLHGTPLPFYWSHEKRKRPEQRPAESHGTPRHDD